MTMTEPITSGGPSRRWALPAGARPEEGVPFADCWITAEARSAADAVLASGWVTSGPQTHAFEAEFAAVVGAEHAVAVSSCTAALELSLRSLRLPPGSPVLVSTYTFCGAVGAVLHAGLRPVLVDVDPESGLQTAEATSRAAAVCEGGPAAMVLVHLTGDPLDVPALAAAAGLPVSRVVVDAAHALGTTVGGRPVGAGPAVCFSFYATKNLPIGEGGMVTTDDPERAAWLRSARLHGMSADAWRRYLPGGSWQYDVPEPGLKANLTDVQAAIGRAQLHHLDSWQQARRRLAEKYDALLGDVPAVALPHRPVGPADRHAWHLYAIRVLPEARRTRDEVAARLGQIGIGTSVHFIPAHRLQGLVARCLLPRGGLPGADRLYSQSLSLPLYPRLTDEQVDRVCAGLVRSLGHTSREVLA